MLRGWEIGCGVWNMVSGIVGGGMYWVNGVMVCGVGDWWSCAFVSGIPTCILDLTAKFNLICSKWTILL